MHHVENINELRKKYALCTHESSKEEMLLHFQEVHDVKIENVELAFINFEAFNEWKNRTEKETKSKFIVTRGAISLKNEKKTHHFVCHRSGFYVSKGKGLRHLKKQGSNKIDGYCPAEIKVFVSETGACNIKFCKTHVGHRNDISQLSLSEFEKSLNVLTLSEHFSYYK
ncbi:uncharacterized protein TNCT_74251 [Trichonephila clavata]|uniref:Uncharacterized protein n=1 Tax=Trichonephila clavata TaxID=2740835 RepID=A0A8X6JE58_TRICU|nr:uncharacterized protein TNCT_74251 [Trichonephila clavata]